MHTSTNTPVLKQVSLRISKSTWPISHRDPHLRTITTRRKTRNKITTRKTATTAGRETIATIQMVVVVEAGVDEVVEEAEAEAMVAEATVAAATTSTTTIETIITTMEVEAVEAVETMATKTTTNNTTSLISNNNRCLRKSPQTARRASTAI